jgi:four helix bundle protein
MLTKKTNLKLRIMRKFEDLVIWKESREMVKEIYNLMTKTKDYGFKDQIQRASVSVMNNISEGSESGSDAIFIRYLKIAKGSCGEVRSMLYICEDLNICSLEESKVLIEKVIKISSGIYQLIKYLEVQKS